MSATGLTTRQASLLAYSAGWVSGLALLLFEPDDAEVRWHAAQSVVGFGALTLVGLALAMLAGVGLLSSILIFRFAIALLPLVVLVAIGAWAWSLWRVASGASPVWPLIGDRAARLARIRA